MINFIQRIMNSSIMWGSWLLIPFIMEFVPALRSLFLLGKRKKKKYEKIQFFPNITLLIPVYNSKETLYKCIQSIEESSYPNEYIDIILIDNKGNQEDFQVFDDAQNHFSTLKMQWLTSKQGKSKALNMALYNSTGKYIVNVDSDGFFDKYALENLIRKFESNTKISCMTGAILTDYPLIKECKNPFLRFIQKLEFFEYAQAFLAGRSYAAENNAIYTLSGAFSAFRKSAILQSQLYNTDTICEDTQMTFQMKYLFDLEVDICENAIFYVDPIESVNKLYTQRQRWQRGSLEVSKMFQEKMTIFNFFKDVNIRTIFYDHTFAFPRVIWYIVTLFFILTNYSADILATSFIFMYIAYIFISFCYFYNAYYYLKKIGDVSKFYLKNIIYICFLPFFNFIVFFFRLAGIINSINTDSSWKTNDFKTEMKNIKEAIKTDFKKDKNKNA